MVELLLKLAAPAGNKHWQMKLATG